MSSGAPWHAEGPGTGPALCSRLRVPRGAVSPRPGSSHGLPGDALGGRGRTGPAGVRTCACGFQPGVFLANAVTEAAGGPASLSANCPCEMGTPGHRAAVPAIIPVSRGRAHRSGDSSVSFLSGSGGPKRVPHPRIGPQGRRRALWAEGGEQAAREKHSSPHTSLARSGLRLLGGPQPPSSSLVCCDPVTGPCWSGSSAKRRQLAALSVVGGLRFREVPAHHRVAPKTNTRRQGRNGAPAHEGPGGPGTRVVGRSGASPEGSDSWRTGQRGGGGGAGSC